MANFLQAVAAALSKVLPKKPVTPYAPGAGPSTGLDMGQVETPVYAPAKPIAKQPIGLEPATDIMSSPQIQELMGGIKSAQGVLAQPLPKLAKAEETPLEGLSALLLSGVNPFAAQKTLAVPGQMAQARADAINQPALLNYQQNRENAQSTIGTNTKLIDIALDRDAVSERTRAYTEKAKLDVMSKRELAELRGDSEAFKLFASLAGKGELNQSTLTEYYLRKKDQFGNYVYDDQQAASLASDTMQRIDSDPSLKARLMTESQRFKQDAESAKQKQDRIEGFMKTVLSDNATITDRKAAGLGLAEDGHPQFRGMTIQQIEEWAAQKGARTLKTEAGTEYTQMKTQLEPKVFAQRKQEFDRKLSFLESSHKDKMAATWARVQISKDLAEIAQQNANTAEGRLAVAELKAELDAARDEAEEAFDDALFDLEQKKAGEKNPAKISKIEAEIEYLQNQYWGKIATKAGVTPGEVAANPFSAVTKVAHETTKKPLLGPIGGKNPPIPPKPKPIKKGETKTFDGGIKVTRTG